MSKKVYLRFLILLSGFIAMCNQLQAAELQFESGVEQNLLIELYTSQGCSSCPPAEEYLNTLKSKDDLWDKVIPMAFHVDYWDYIGWKDAYAHPSHTTRQQAYARANRMSTIYTPGFFANGSEWRRGFFNRRLPYSNSKSGVLSANIKDQEIVIKFKPYEPLDQALRFNIALLGMGLATEIEAGERSGRHTKHDFVVLAKSKSRNLTSKNKVYEWRTQLPENNTIKPSKYAVVVWVNKAITPAPLQAIGSYLPE